MQLKKNYPVCHSLFSFAPSLFRSLYSVVNALLQAHDDTDFLPSMGIGCLLFAPVAGLLSALVVRGAQRSRERK